MQVILLDIETGAQDDLVKIYTEGIKPSGVLKDPEKIKADIEAKTKSAYGDMFVDINFCKIKLIGVMLDGVYKRYDIQEFATWLDTLDNPTFVTFNGIKFDFPIIIRAIIKEDIQIGERAGFILKDCLGRYSTHHIDLFDKITPYGGKGSLDVMSQIYLGEKKTPIDFLTCTDRELEKHNFDDLIMLGALYNKFKPFL